MTPVGMVKAQFHLREEELRALQQLAGQGRCRVADLVRDAVRQVWLQAPAHGPGVAIIQGPVPRCSAEHDSAFDEI